jgi:hypothetical protein
VRRGAARVTGRQRLYRPSVRVLVVARRARRGSVVAFRRPGWRVAILGRSAGPGGADLGAAENTFRVLFREGDGRGRSP